MRRQRRLPAVTIRVSTRVATIRAATIMVEVAAEAGTTDPGTTELGR
jgi:hypothetical protein